MLKLSVIVPIYNVAKYLPRCLNSLIEQSERDMEIILVNDGSTDNSLSICEEFAKKDNRIVIKSKKNGGVNSARNFGFKCAAGRYVSFIDSDDYVEKNMFSNFELGENSTIDIFIFGFSFEYKNRSIKNTFSNDINGVYNDEEIRKKIVPKFLVYGKELDDNLQMLSAWRMIFKREFLEKNNLVFSETIASLDDSLFAITALRYAEKAEVSSKIHYYYLKRKGSLMFSGNPKFNEDYLAVFEHIKNFKFPIAPQYFDNPNFYYVNILAMIKNSSCKNFFTAKRELKQIINNAFVNSVIKKISVKKITSKKILFFLVKYKLFVLLIVLYKIKSQIEWRELL